MLDVLFSEEVGWILEVEDLKTTLKTFASNSVPAFFVGKTTSLGLGEKITIEVAGQQVLQESVFRLMRTWEETSAQLEKRQSNVTCAEEEFLGLETRKVPFAKLTFDPDCWVPKQTPVRVAVIREEGINGDREMAAACIQAGFETWDVTVTDLLNGQVTLDRFRGVIFPGGFSYADVLGSAKGWAASLLFHPDLSKQLDGFRRRTDTFSLGVCNGCQLMSLLGWVGSDTIQNDPQVSF